MPNITVTTVDGGRLELQGVTGQTVMEVLRDGQVNDEIGLCGGVASCATCHVYLAGEPELAAIDDDEEDILASLDNREASSRLSCQIELSDTTQDLELVMPAEV
jgi:ferredoxin, 2Fe-2S